jgi:SMODS-associating 2TM, beta-strand rich effector domain
MSVGFVCAAMKLDHDYSVLEGHNRASIGRWIQVAAAAISGGIVFVLLSAVDLAERFGLNVNLPPMVLSLAGAGTVYLGLYWLFNHHLWKHPRISKLLKVPHLAGTWRCEGVTLEKEPYIHWSGTITIVQSWDKLRVHLETAQSGSDSITAALIHDEAVGYRLMYHYANRPRIGEQHMAAHQGFAELVFSHDCSVATGEYFNGRGRNTWGTITLERIAG